MYAMLINIVKAKANEGESYSFELDFPVKDDLLEGRGCKFLGPVHLVGEYYYKNEELFLDSLARVNVLCVCDNCGEEFEKVFEFRVDEKFVENYASHDEEDYLVNQGGIEIDDALINNLLLYFPSRVLCKEDCKGLCPICGKNKNKYTCNCEALQEEEERRENPFNNLKK